MEHLTHHCSSCKHRASGIFCDLAGTHLTQLDHEKSVHQFKPGEVIFYEGTPPFALYCIYSGLVKLYKTNRKGDQYIIRLLRAGDVIGYRAIFENDEFAATAEAVQPSIICTISKEMIFALLGETPKLAIRLLGKMAMELRISEEQMLSFAQEPVLQRTARVLLFLMQDKKTSQRSLELSLPLLRREIAQMVGTSPETLSRTLHTLVQKQILRVAGSKVYIINLSALQALAARPTGWV